jgi:putative transposase
MPLTQNSKFARSGHFWQNRFFSCALDPEHLRAALRYIERNPVRARMVEQASAYRWSSAAGQWETYLNSDTIGEAELLLRTNTYMGRPCGSPEFVEWAEANLGRRLAPLPGGRPTKANALRA